MRSIGLQACLSDISPPINETTQTDIPLVVQKIVQTDISPGVHKKVQTETTNLVEEGTQSIEFWSAAETIFNSTAIEDPDDEITMDDSIDNSSWQSEFYW